jgi:hypothetical protein
MGHLFSKGKHGLGITGIPLLQTKRELQIFLCLIGYCVLWIESYALRTKTLYSKLLEEEPDPLCCEPEEVQTIESLKQSLITAPVLGLPSLEKPFHLFVNVNKGTALGGSNSGAWGNKTICGLFIQIPFPCNLRVARMYSSSCCYGPTD